MDNEDKIIKPIFNESVEVKDTEGYVKKRVLVQVQPWEYQGFKGSSLVIKSTKMGGKTTQVWLDINDPEIKTLILRAYEVNENSK